MVSRFAKKPSLEYLNAINQILRYLAGSCGKKITFRGEKELRLVEYSDFNWARDHAD